MAPDSVGSLITRLAKQHELEAAAVQALREENARLSEELRRLHGADGLAGSGEPEDQPKRAETPRELEPAPDKEEESGVLSGEQRFRRHSFPTLIPGMPRELCRPSGQKLQVLIPSSGKDEGLGEEPPRKSGASVESIRLEPEQLGTASGDVTVIRASQGSDLNLPGALCEVMPTGGPPKETTRVSMRRTSVTAPGLLNRGSSFLLERTVADLETQNFSKQKIRFRHVLDLDGSIVFPHDIVKAVRKRSKVDYRIEQARIVMQELNVLECEVAGVTEDEAIEKEPSDGIDFDTFVQLIAMPDLLVRCKPEVVEEVHVVQSVLLPQVVNEVITRVTKSQASMTSLLSSGMDRLTHKKLRSLAVLNVFVGIVVVLSICSLGASMDVHPDWPGWIVLEVCFGVVFVVEVAIKMAILGVRDYLRGPGWKWNWFDTAITFLTLVDLTLSLVTIGVQDVANLSTAKLTLVLRALRLARIARLVKLLHTPILAGLTNMLAGFLVGVPCMMWVMVLLSIIFYVLGMVFRQLVGPPQGLSRIATCGTTGDFVDMTISDPWCKPHILYGEEFFGSVWMSMFTVFRCVLGDCSTQAGKSLTAAFSEGYGIAFDLVYCGGMVLVVFGLFNIIAAIFVETTISGLKFNHAQRKYARLYESRYVQQRLEALVDLIQEIQCEERHGHFEVEEFVLNEESFERVMQDDRVNMVLEDLDIVLTNRVGLFDMFDCDNNGEVTVSEFVGTLMKIRGEPQKSDMIASWVALRSLNERFQDFERLLLDNQRKMLEYQRELLAKNQRPDTANLPLSMLHCSSSASCTTRDRCHS